MLKDSSSGGSSFFRFNVTGAQSDEGKVLDQRKSATFFEPLDRGLPNIESANHQMDNLFVSLSQSIKPLTDLQALRRAAYLGEQQKQQGYLLAKSLVASNAPELAELHAEPLSPLKSRDVDALGALFQREDICAIEVDISQMLLRLFPEPCWEDDPFEFLKEFL